MQKTSDCCCAPAPRMQTLTLSPCLPDALPGGPLFLILSLYLVMSTPVTMPKRYDHCYRYTGKYILLNRSPSRTLSTSDLQAELFQ